MVDKKPTYFEVLKPFVEQTDEVLKTGRWSTEWILSFATTYLGLMIAGITYLIAHKEIITVVLWEKIALAVLGGSFILSIIFAFICWMKVRVRLISYKLEPAELVYMEADDEFIRNAQKTIVENFEKIKKANNSCAKLIVIARISLIVGIVGTVGVLFYKFLC